jgi:hypothetical protein
MKTDTSTSMREEPPSVLHPRIRSAMQVCIFVGFGIITIGFFSVLVWSVRHETNWLELAQRHAPSILGLPMAAFASYAIVASLSFTSGPTTFKAFGFEFSGSAGQIIMWVLCFLAITTAIVVTWSLNTV